MATATVDGWSVFFKEIARLVDGAERQDGIASISYSEYMIERLDVSIGTCISIQEYMNSSEEQNQLQEYSSSISELVRDLQTMQRKWEQYLNHLEGPAHTLHPDVLLRGRPGRPRFIVDQSQIEYLASLSFKWSEIACILGISRMTLYRRRLDYGLVTDPSDTISDDDLQAAMKRVKQSQPFSGVSMMWGNLRAAGVKVTRERVRRMLRSIDPLGRILRCIPGSIRRQPYSVPGPNSLWHIDSHHKLIRWRMVTHGAIDGYSRLILYLKCTANNRSTTVYEFFLGAVQKFNLPSRVRSDQGLENILVATHMLENRGSERHSILTGASTHNQRIERLWRDMHSSVTVLYYKLFYFLEEQALLDPLDELALWALHYVYVPRINRSLTEFVNGWNNHSIRTANHKTPHQLFAAGCLILQNSGIDALDTEDHVDENYGIDPDSDLVADSDSIVVPENRITFSDVDFRALKQTIDPLGASDSHGIDIYEQTLQYISTLQQQ